MVPHSSILAWRIPWTEEPGGLQSIGSQSLTRLKPLSLHARTHFFFGCVALQSRLDIRVQINCSTAYICDVVCLYQCFM